MQRTKTTSSIVRYNTAKNLSLSPGDLGLRRVGVDAEVRLLDPEEVRLLDVEDVLLLAAEEVRMRAAKDTRRSAAEEARLLAVREERLTLAGACWAGLDGETGLSIPPKVGERGDSASPSLCNARLCNSRRSRSTASKFSTVGAVVSPRRSRYRLNLA